MKGSVSRWLVVAGLLLIVSRFAFCVCFAEEPHRFYSVIYDCAGSRDTGIVVANAGGRDTSYTLELYDAFGNLLLTLTRSLAPFESAWHDLTTLLAEEAEGVDWEWAWGLCIVRPLVYATDLLSVSVEVFEDKNLLTVYQIAPSHY